MFLSNERGKNSVIVVERGKNSVIVVERGNNSIIVVERGKNSIIVFIFDLRGTLVSCDMLTTILS